MFINGGIYNFDLEDLLRVSMEVLGELEGALTFCVRQCWRRKQWWW